MNKTRNHAVCHVSSGFLSEIHGNTIKTPPHRVIINPSKPTIFDHLRWAVAIEIHLDKAFRDLQANTRGDQNVVSDMWGNTTKVVPKKTPNCHTLWWMLAWTTNNESNWSSICYVNAIAFVWTNDFQWGWKQAVSVFLEQTLALVYPISGEVKVKNDPSWNLLPRVFLVCKFHAISFVEHGTAIFKHLYHHLGYILRS